MVAPPELAPSLERAARLALADVRELRAEFEAIPDLAPPPRGLLDALQFKLPQAPIPLAYLVPLQDHVMTVAAFAAEVERGVQAATTTARDGQPVGSVRAAAAALYGLSLITQVVRVEVQFGHVLVYAHRTGLPSDQSAGWMISFTREVSWTVGAVLSAAPDELPRLAQSVIRALDANVPKVAAAARAARAGEILSRTIITTLDVAMALGSIVSAAKGLARLAVGMGGPPPPAAALALAGGGAEVASVRAVAVAEYADALRQLLQAGLIVAMAPTGASQPPPPAGTGTTDGPGYQTGEGEVLGEIDPASVQARPGTAPFGRAVEPQLDNIVKTRWPKTQFRFSRGPNRPDVEVIGGDDPGFKFADYKPDTLNQWYKFRLQARRWAANLFPGQTLRVAMFGYRPDGTVYVVDHALVGPHVGL